MKKLEIKLLNNRHYQECGFLLLGTEDNSAPLCKDIKYLDYQLSKHFDNMEYPVYMHYYVLSDEPICEGDWYVVNQYGDGLILATQPATKLEIGLQDFHECYKVIATSNKSLKIGSIEGKECGAFKSDDYQHSDECGWCGGDWSKCLVSYPQIKDVDLEEIIELLNTKGSIEKLLVQYSAPEGIITSDSEWELKLNDDSSEITLLGSIYTGFSTFKRK